MSFQAQIEAASATSSDPHLWLGQVLTSFATAEQALGKLALAVGLSISNGSLSDLSALREKLRAADTRRLKLLDHRIDRWCRNRPMRHLLAHATITVLFDREGQEVIITRHLPRDREDATPDRMWTLDEREEILRQARTDGRSICDRVKAMLADQGMLAKLRA